MDIIIEATAQILKQEGPDGASTNRIAARAGVSVGSIYQYFPNKEALFAAVARRLVVTMEQVLAEQLPQLISEEPEAAVYGLIRAIWALQQEDPILYQRISRLELPEAEAVLESFEARTEGLLAGVLLSRLQPGEDPILVAKVLVRTVAGLIQQSSRRDPQAFHDPRLEAELAKMIAGYLLPKTRTP